MVMEHPAISVTSILMTGFMLLHFLHQILPFAIPLLHSCSLAFKQKTAVNLNAEIQQKFPDSLNLNDT